MPRRVPWNASHRRHGEAWDCFAQIAGEVASRGLSLPGSSGNRQITVTNSNKPWPQTVYVGKRNRKQDHLPGTPWYIEWENHGSEPRAERIEHYEFADCCEVIAWLREKGF